MRLGRFVRVAYEPLRELLAVAVQHENLRSLAEQVSKSGVFDEECAALEHRDEVLYHRLLDE